MRSIIIILYLHHVSLKYNFRFYNIICSVLFFQDQHYYYEGALHRQQTYTIEGPM